MEILDLIVYGIVAVFLLATTYIVILTIRTHEMSRYYHRLISRIHDNNVDRINDLVLLPLDREVLEQKIVELRTRNDLAWKTFEKVNQDEVWYKVWRRFDSFYTAEDWKAMLWRWDNEIT